MLAKHYPELFADEPDAEREAVAFAAKCRELVSFLVDTLGREQGRRVLRGRRHLSRFLLGPARTRRPGPAAQAAGDASPGLKLVELEDSDVCCGFGGTFAVKYGELSDAIVAKKSANIAATEADTLLAGDLGCLINMAGKLQREGAQAARAPRRRGAGRHDRRSPDRRGESRQMTVATTTPLFKDNVHEALHDPRLQRAMASAGNFVPRRTAAAERLPEFEALRDSARDIKTHTLAHLDLYLEAYEKRVTEAGGHVHYARDAEEARRDLPRPLQGARAPSASPRASR